MIPAPDATHDPGIGSWVASADGHPDFPLQNLPFGLFRAAGAVEGPAAEPRGGVRIGDEIADLRALAGSGLLSGDAQTAATAASATTLNRLFEAGAGPRRALRRQLHRLLATGSTQQGRVAELLHPVGEAEVLLPAAVGDYTDFYAGIHHARKVGSLFRPENPLLPNYQWVPVGYHGRASSVQVSGEPFHRPRGQILDGSGPRYLPTRQLDFELELGVWVGPGNRRGHPVPIGAAADHIAGFCLLNDWSARDVQRWEAKPLGPFLAKNFATSVSAWVVTPEALAPFRGPLDRRVGDLRPLPYLDDEPDQRAGGLDIDLQVLLSTAAMRAHGIAPQELSASSTRHLYWTVAQLVTHHTSGGCDLRPGDLLGSGTISAPTPDGYGSLLEITSGGRDVVRLPGGEERTFLQDGDEVILRARAHRPGAASIGFGECRAIVQPTVDPAATR